VEVAIISESHKVLAGSLGRESYFGSLFWLAGHHASVNYSWECYIQYV
jgi:hypothetical protein